jgi:hypothetical protein
MTVLDMIVKESMRLMSVAPGGSREYKSTRNSLFSTNNVIIYSARVDKRHSIRRVLHSQRHCRVGTAALASPQRT